jgi:hypothetical protein
MKQVRPYGSDASALGDEALFASPAFPTPADGDDSVCVSPRGNMVPGGLFSPPPTSYGVFAGSAGAPVRPMWPSGGVHSSQSVVPSSLCMSSPLPMSSPSVATPTAAGTAGGRKGSATPLSINVTSAGSASGFTPLRLPLPLGSPPVPVFVSYAAGATPLSSAPGSGSRSLLTAVGITKKVGDVCQWVGVPVMHVHECAYDVWS